MEVSLQTALTIGNSVKNLNVIKIVVEELDLF